MRRRHPVLALVLIVIAAHAAAQSQRPQPSDVELRNLETALTRDPQYRAARAKLLEYYFHGRVDPSIAVPARRRHILWLIENTPADELAGGPTATIDPSGHSLADPEGFKQASAAWRAQVGKPEAQPAALVNAAYFFKTADKAYTISLLNRALSLTPGSKEIAARLGDEYALAIMCVTAVNWTGYPVQVNLNLIDSALAKQARDVLKSTQNPYLLAKAGYMLLWQGSVLYNSRILPFDPEPLAKSALDRAVRLAPGDKEVAGYRGEYDKWQSEKKRLLAGRVESGAESWSPEPVVNRDTVAGRTEPNPEAAPPAAAAIAGAARAVISEEKAPDLTKVTAGMSRAQVLTLGPPDGRISMDEDGHLIEIFQYSANGTRLGSIRLTDGTVSSVKLQ